MENSILLKNFIEFKQTVSNCWLGMVKVYLHNDFAVSEMKLWDKLIVSERIGKEILDEESLKNYKNQRLEDLLEDEQTEDLEKIKKQLLEDVSLAIQKSEEIILLAEYITQDKFGKAGEKFLARAILNSECSSVDLTIDDLIMEMRLISECGIELN